MMLPNKWGYALPGAGPGGARLPAADLGSNRPAKNPFDFQTGSNPADKSRRDGREHRGEPGRRAGKEADGEIAVRWGDCTSLVLAGRGLRR